MAIVPHCGECRAETSANIACQPLDHHYQIYYCTGCGAVYSIVSKPTLPETTPAAPRDVLTSVKTPLKESPICPQHNLPLQKKTVPAGKKDAGKTFWVCPRVKECHQYREISPEPDILDTHRLILAEVGEADLSNKEAVTPERMQAKMRAAQLFRPGTRYMRIAYDPGPPICSEHNLEMEEYTIPASHKNAGRKIWYCPRYGECHKWELAE